MARSPCAATQAAAFNGSEHKEIGDAGFKAALIELARAQPDVSGRIFAQPYIHGRHRTIGAVVGGQEFARFSFGDLVAIYGDHVRTVEELNSKRFRRHSRSLTDRAETLKRIMRGVPVQS